MTMTMRRPKQKRVSEKSTLIWIDLTSYYCVIERQAFRAKMKGHYKGEFNAAALLRQKPPVDSEEDDE